MDPSPNKHGRRYDREFKEQAVALVLQSGQSVAKAASGLGRLDLVAARLGQGG